MAQHPISTLALAALAALGCSAPATGPAPITFFPEQGGPPLDMTHQRVQPRARIDLRALLGPDADVTGVAVDPASGVRFVVDSQRGLYRLDPGGGATQVWDGSSVAHPITDVVAIGHGLVAVSTPDEGYFVGGTAGVAGHFCYVPSGVPVYGGALPPDGHQLTRALALAPASSSDAARIVAQPQTFDRQTGTLLASHFGFFAPSTGDDLSWLEIADPNFQVSAMAVLPDGDTLLMSTESADLYSSNLYTLSLSRPTFLYSANGWWRDDLAIDLVEGFAVDAAAGSLIIVDGGRQILFEIALSDWGGSAGGGG